MDTIALSLARKMLTPVPDKRPTIEQIMNHPWMRENYDFRKHISHFLEKELLY